MKQRKRAHRFFVLFCLSLTLLSGCGKQESEQVTKQTYPEVTIPTHEPILKPEQKKKMESQQMPINTAVSENASSRKEVSQNEASEMTEDASTPRKLHYIDAWGEWHDTIINENVEKHVYDFTLLQNDGKTISYDDGVYTIRKGIDVSHHQGEIDWQKVRDAGYEFAFLRIAYRGYGEEGTLNKDRNFDVYLEGARAAGMDVGVYMFSQAVNEAEAKEEAEYVLKILQGTALELPVVYDPESIRDDVARTDSVSGEQFTRNTIVFCDTIRAAGYEPMIYSNMIWEAELLDLEKLSNYPIWYADYEKIPQTPYHFSYWQYTSDGNVPGIAGRVDLDVQFLRK